jgi:2,4-dienoyl-CoA reductase (NADPH2)
MSANNKYKKLFEPYQIGNVKTRNRLIKTGASMLYWHDDETHMNYDTLAFYEAIARGGVGLLIVESPILDYPLGGRWRERYRMDNDRYIKGMSELVSVIHKQGCPTFMQMCHDGPWQSPLFPNNPATFSGKPIGASPVNLDQPGDFHRDVPRQLKISEIESLVDKIAAVAVRAQKAGFDGIDINSGSSHLFHNFLSPFWNRRKDAYGGTQEKRAKFLVDTIKEIKKRAGKDFPVCICMNGIEVGQAIGVPNSDCLTPENALKAALLFEEAGADAIQVRSNWLGYHVGGFLPDQLYFPEFPVPLNTAPKEYNTSEKGKGANVIMAANFKKNLSIPVITVGRIDADMGEKILSSGKADFIAMHRPFMADPEYANKLFSGRSEEIAPCTRCGTCLDQSIAMHRRCRINAAMGTKKYTVDKADRKKKVLVIGGGPAGMEAARVAALRGHNVTLCDKAHKLGGLLSIAALVKGLEIEDLPSIVRYFKAHFKKLGVKVNLGKEITSSFIRKLKPDALILAGGGSLVVPDLPGIKNKNVISGPALHKQLKFYLRFISPGILRWLTNFYFPVGKKVVVIGSGMHGFELAEFFIKRNRKVTIVDTAKEPGEGMLDYRLGLSLSWLEKKGVNIITKLKKIEVVDNGIKITTDKGKTEIIEADTVVPANPSKSNYEMLKGFEDIVSEVYAIGDCKEPAMIVDAIAAGWQTANKI